MRTAPVILALILLAAGCGQEPRTREFTFFTFGTLVELTVANTDEATAREARALAVSRLEQWHHDWNAWKPGPLRALNQDLAAGREVAIPPGLEGLIPRARALAADSGGLFDPAIGRLIGLWGFHSDSSPGGPPPPDRKVRELVERGASMADLVVEAGRVRSTNPSVQLDFGAFAKGVAVARLAEAIRALGVENFLLNAGGDLQAAGSHGDRPWRIGIRDPRGTGVLASLEPGDGEAVFTSGDYERYFTWDGTRYHHIIDPRTGRPARGVRSVTVIHRDAARADAAATALFVAGPEAWPSVAARLEVSQVMLVDDRGNIHLSPAMQERVRILAEPRPQVIVKTP